jgi:hypothetical protein
MSGALVGEEEEEEEEEGEEEEEEKKKKKKKKYVRTSCKDKTPEEISGSHSGAAEDPSPVDCYAVLTAKKQAFRTTSVPSSSGSNNPGRVP